jgi:hypothetical protein
MRSPPDTAIPPSASCTDLTPAGLSASPAFQLAEASRALWLATLALMTAFMQTGAPAHRCLLARRIARNFGTLAQQDCFDSRSRASFRRLAHRWQANADQLAPQPAEAPRGLLDLLF